MACFIAILVTGCLIGSFHHDTKQNSQVMHPAIAALLVVLFVTIALICYLTTGHRSALDIFLSIFINLLSGAWFIFDATQIARKRQEYLKKFPKERNDPLGSWLDSATSSLRLYLNIVAAFIYLVELCQEANRKKKSYRRR